MRNRSAGEILRVGSGEGFAKLLEGGAVLQQFGPLGAAVSHVVARVVDVDAADPEVSSRQLVAKQERSIRETRLNGLEELLEARDGFLAGSLLLWALHEGRSADLAKDVVEVVANLIVLILNHCFFRVVAVFRREVAHNRLALVEHA